MAIWWYDTSHQPRLLDYFQFDLPLPCQEVTWNVQIRLLTCNMFMHIYSIQMISWNLQTDFFMHCFLHMCNSSETAWQFRSRRGSFFIYYWLLLNYVDIQVEADILWIKQKACGVPCLSIGELHYYKLFHLTYVCYSWPVCCMEEHKTFTRFWSIKGTHQVTVSIPHP